MCNKDKEPELMEVLRRFSNRMRLKFMDSYDEKKDSWKRLEKEFYINKIRSCFKYLEACCPDNDKLNPRYDYADKCADLANYAMMLAENCLQDRYTNRGKLKYPEKVDAYIKEIIVGSAGKNHLTQFKVESVYIGDDGVAHIFIDEGKK